MSPISELSAKDASHIRYVLFDIDDTITTKGKLTAEAYQSLWNLSDAGLKTVSITDRLAGVVGENRALAYWEEKGVLIPMP